MGASVLLEPAAATHFEAQQQLVRWMKNLRNEASDASPCKHWRLALSAAGQLGMLAIGVEWIPPSFHGCQHAALQLEGSDFAKRVAGCCPAYLKYFGCRRHSSWTSSGVPLSLA